MNMNASEHEPCVSEVSSTISRLRLHNSPISNNANDDKDSCCSTLVSESTSERNVRCELRPLTSTFTIQPFTDSTLDSNLFQVPIIGYEVMEERARFTVYKLRIENKSYGDCWFVFRRYTDFVRLHSKLKRDFPSYNLALPRKRWFGDNFNSSFLEDRIQGLQMFINSILNYPHMRSSECVREFFCLDEPPSYADATEESRPIFDAMEETIYHLRCQLRDKEWELQKLKSKLDHFSQLKNSSKICTHCKSEVEKCLHANDQDSPSPVKSSVQLQ